MRPDQMTVLLTGACGGIGRELANQLAEAGASLYLTGRDTRVLNEMQGKFRQQAVAGQVIFAEAVELLDDYQLEDWVDSILKREKAVNVLVNNAGIAHFGLFENLAAMDIEQMVYLNSIIPMKLTRKLLPSMKRLEQARIVNVASTFGAIGFPGYSVYSASKYALRGFRKRWPESFLTLKSVSVVFCRGRREPLSITPAWSNSIVNSMSRWIRRIWSRPGCLNFYPAAKANSRSAGRKNYWCGLTRYSRRWSAMRSRRSYR